MVVALVPVLAMMAVGAAVTVVRVELAGRGVAVAVNVTLAFKPATVAARAFEPGVGPRVQLPTVAIPLVLVVAGLPLTLPFPAVTTNATATPGTGLLNVSLTMRSEEHTSELQSRLHLVCRLLLEKKKT